jgi:hypothetical protein
VVNRVARPRIVIRSETGAAMAKAKIMQTSSDSATVEPIVLRDGELARMVFKPQIVNNKQDENKPVRGHVLWQKRGKADAAAEWVDESHIKLSSMTAGSGLKLEFSTDELYLLTQAVRGLYGVYWKHGKQLPKTGEEFNLADYMQIAKSLDTLSGVAQLVESTGWEGVASLLKWLANHKDPRQVIDRLSQMNQADLTEINALAGIGILKQALDTWKKQEGNHSEDFWQKTLANYSFVFSQVFSSPIVLFGDQRYYVGGKSVEGTGGKAPDFLLKNELTAHLLIVEIKTPTTDLLVGTAYRPPNVFAPSRELAGAVTQVATYKDTFLRNHAILRLDAKEPFRLVDPRCLVVIGDMRQLDAEGKLDSFEQFRRALKGIDVITFDELFRKVELLLDLLEGRSSSVKAAV